VKTPVKIDMYVLLPKAISTRWSACDELPTSLNAVWLQRTVDQIQLITACHMTEVQGVCCPCWNITLIVSQITTKTTSTSQKNTQFIETLCYTWSEVGSHLVLSYHSLDETGSLAWWIWHDNSTTNIVLNIIIIIFYTLRCKDPEN